MGSSSEIKAEKEHLNHDIVIEYSFTQYLAKTCKKFWAKNNKCVEFDCFPANACKKLPWLPGFVETDVRETECDEGG